MPPAGSEPKISVGKRRQTQALDRTATYTGTVGLTVTLHRSKEPTIGPGFPQTSRTALGHTQPPVQ